MTKEQLVIGQVGCIGPDSFTGLSGDMERQRVPRLVVLEPNGPTCDYNNPNKNTADVARETGNRVVFADIYDPLKKWSGPLLGFMFLENVLNDLDYYSLKNRLQLAQNLEIMMADGGLVLVVHTGDPTIHPDFYESVIDAMNAYSFTTILDEVTGPNYIPVRFDEYYPQREKILIESLEKLNLLDEPLKQGIKAHGDASTEYWLLFRKQEAGK